MNEKTTVSERIRDLREEKNTTQTEIARVLGTTQQIYSNYELGKCELPLRHLVHLAEFYDVSTDYLLGRAAYPKAPPELSCPFVNHVTFGEFICRITTFKERSRRLLVEYVNYLFYLENQKKKN